MSHEIFKKCPNCGFENDIRSEASCFNCEQDYIRLEEEAKKWLSETDDYQFETWELLVMFTGKEISKLNN